MRLLLSVFSLLLCTSAYAQQPDLYFQFAKAMQNTNVEAAQELIAQGIDINSPEIQRYLGKTALHEAVDNESLILAKLILETGEVNVNEKNHVGWVPLHLSVFNGDKPMTEFLLSKGADFNAIDYFENSPLFWARSRHNPNRDQDIINMLEAASKTQQSQHHNNN